MAFWVHGWKVGKALRAGLYEKNFLGGVPGNLVYLMVKGERFLDGFSGFLFSVFWNVGIFFGWCICDFREKGGDL